MLKFLFSYGKILLTLFISISCVQSDGAGANSPDMVTKQGAAIVSSPAPASFRIAFLSDRDRRFYFEIYTMNSNGSGVTRLTENLADEKTPAFSPDGSRIVFSSDRTGNYEIYTMNADGDEVVRLTTSRAYNWQPAWSPDGKRIAFTSNRDGNWDVYVMNADGSGLVRLTDASAYDWQPAWSPDGQRIAFTSDRDGRWEIYVTLAPHANVGVNSDGSNVKRLTHPPSDARDPAWSPDGQRIAFASTRDGVWEIYTMRSDGSDITRLTRSNVINQSPAWSPDGTRIVYESDSTMMAMNVDGSAPVYLLMGSAVNSHPSCTGTKNRMD